MIRVDSVNMNCSAQLEVERSLPDHDVQESRVHVTPILHKHLWTLGNSDLLPGKLPNVGQLGMFNFILFIFGVTGKACGLRT